MPGPVHNRRGTTIRFQPDPEIFGDAAFSPARLYRLCRSKAYLFRGVEIRWACDPALLGARKDDDAGRGGAALSRAACATASTADIGERPRVLPQPWAGEAELPGGRRAAASNGRSPGWSEDEGFLHSYCNTIPTAAGRHARGRASAPRC